VSAQPPAAQGGPPLKVLHVAETAQGGVGSYIEEILPLQARRYGADAVRVVLPREHAIHFERLPAASMHAFALRGAGRMRSMLRMARLTLRQVREWRPDVVHLHSTYAGFVLRPLLALLPSRPRVVYCAHGWAFDRHAPRWLNRLVARIERLWARWSDVAICISRHDLESAQRVGIDSHRLAMVVNGIGEIESPLPSATSAQPWPDGRLRVLFVGRLDRQKGIDVLYDAMRQLGDRASALVVGSAVVADERVAEPPANVHVTGWLPRDRIATHYANAQVLVVPSRWEGFGLVAVEAMRAGRAVVASRVGGLPEVVEHGVTGWLLDPEDAQSLATLLGELTPETLCAMGAAGRLRFERLFHVRRVGDELDGLYRRLLEPHAVCSGRHIADGT